MVKGCFLETGTEWTIDVDLVVSNARFIVAGVVDFS